MKLCPVNPSAHDCGVEKREREKSVVSAAPQRGRHLRVPSYNKFSFGVAKTETALEAGFLSLWTSLPPLLTSTPFCDSVLLPPPRAEQGKGGFVCVCVNQLSSAESGHRAARSVVGFRGG